MSQLVALLDHYRSLSQSRKILYQALFCRSETGLLHKEQGPTMPSLADAVMQAKRQ